MFALRVSVLTRAVMGRQQTLGQSRPHLSHPPRLTNTSFFAGKFFTMPKSTKAAPPQQASLQEMWGKKKAPKASDASETKPDVKPDIKKEIKSDAMDVDIPPSSQGKVRFTQSTLGCSSSGTAAESSKRKGSPTPPPREYSRRLRVTFPILYSGSPKLKKRKIIDSEDEADPNDVPPTSCTRLSCTAGSLVD